LYVCRTCAASIDWTVVAGESVAVDIVGSFNLTSSPVQKFTTA
jgi:hypothetical protein